MTDTPKPLVQASHDVRLTFEKVGTWTVIIALALGCAVCLVSTFPYGWAGIMAARIKDVAQTLASFVGLLAGAIGMSWTRGHMDERLNGDK